MSHSPTRRGPSRPLVLLTGLLAMGCPLEPRVVDLRPDTGQPEQPGDSQEPPSLSVGSASLDFGAVAVGEHHEKELVLINVGGSDLSIAEVAIADEDAPFAVVLLGQVSLAPGADTRLTIAFEPVTDGPVNSAVLIGSDDPTRPTISVDLNGDGVAPVLEVEPSTVALGPTWVGCTASDSLWLYNAGSEALLITEVGFDTVSVELAFDLATQNNGPLPWSLSAERTMELGTVTHTPDDARDDQAYLIVGSSDDRVEDLRIDVVAEAAYWGQGNDLHTVPTGVVDVVLAVDHSSSMDPFLPSLSAGLPVLASALADRGLDLHLAAVVDDDGCVNGEEAWLDQGTPSAEAEAAVDAMLQPDGGATNNERAFLLLQAALDAADAGGCNEGLLRAGSGLHLVGVSDEPEQSPGTWASHLATLRSLHASPGTVTLHAIGGDDAGCGTGDYVGFTDAVVATSGEQLSLCDEDLPGALDDLAASMASSAGEPDGTGPYSLSAVPVQATLVVRVDGVPTTSGWSYDAVGNSVWFQAGSAPSAGAEVALSYAVQPDSCGQ